LTRSVGHKSSSRPEPELLTRLQKGIARNLVGTVFNQGSTFALNVVAAHALGRVRFGEFMIVQATLITVGNLGQFATGYTATKYVAEFRNREPARASRILGLCAAVSSVTGLIMALGLLTAAPYVSTHFLHAPELSTALMIAALGAFFFIVNGYRAGALGGLESYGALARAGVIGGVAYFVLGSVGAAAGGINGGLTGIVASAFVQWVALGLFLHRESAHQDVRTVYDHAWQERRVLTTFALPAALSGFVTLPALWLASALLVRQHGGFDHMALFAAANTFRMVVLFLPNTVNTVGMSLLNNQRRVGDEAYRRVFWWNLAITAALAITVAAIIAAAGKSLLQMFGRNFDEGYGTLLILMVAAVAESVAIAIYQVVQSRAKLWLSLFLIALPRDSLIVLSAYLLTPKMGAAGLATSYAMGWTLALCMTIVLASRLGIRAGIFERPPMVSNELMHAGHL
jgi:O-antigen/teichoic acid export membrane protein